MFSLTLCLVNLQEAMDKYKDEAYLLRKIQELEQDILYKQAKVQNLKCKLSKLARKGKAQEDLPSLSGPVLSVEEKKTPLVSLFTETGSSSLEQTGASQPNVGIPILSTGSPIPKEGIRSQDLDSSVKQEINLRPQAQKINKYYCIFNGPNKGVYTSWPVVSAMVTGKPYAHKAYATEKEALIALNENEALFPTGPSTAQSSKKEQQSFKQAVQFGFAKPTPKNLRPIMPSTEQKAQRLLRTRPGSEPSTERPVSPCLLTYEDFEAHLQKARVMTDSDELCLFTINKKNVSLYGILQGCKQELVRDLFNCGLIDVIYPSNNLQEISLLPRGVFNAIKQFRKNICKTPEKQIYIKMTSSLVDWDDSTALTPYHWIEIGLVKQGTSFPALEEVAIIKDLKDQITLLRTKSLRSVLNKYLKIYQDSCVKINYSDNKIIVISDYQKPITAEEGIKIATNEARFLDGTLQVSEETARNFCQIAPKEHVCSRCEAAKTKEEEERKQ